ncbi:MAG TPA: aspartate/glutamate racemase family protein [Candidatus Limnocylindrales bacterium]
MKRLGVLTPSSNTVLEPATSRLLAPLDDRISVHYSRFRVTRIAPDAGSDGQFDREPMLAAAELLADARVDAILWSGTSAAWLGLDADRRLVASIESATSVPATTSTLALLDALDALAVRRYGLVVPYVSPIADAIQRNLADAGYACIASTAEGLTDNRSFAGVDGATLAERVRSVAAAGPDAVVVHCTNLRGAEVAVALEDELGIPVLDSVIVGAWGALRLLDLPTDLPRLGRLAGAEARPREPAPADA